MGSGACQGKWDNTQHACFSRVSDGVRTRLRAQGGYARWRAEAQQKLEVLEGEERAAAAAVLLAAEPAAAAVKKWVNGALSAMSRMADRVCSDAARVGSTSNRSNSCDRP